MKVLVTNVIRTSFGRDRRSGGRLAPACSRSTARAREQREAPHARAWRTACAVDHYENRLVARLWNPRTLDLYSQPTGTMLAEALEQRCELREVGR